MSANPGKAATGTHRPIRQCVGCGARAPQRELLRIAVVNGRLTADPWRRVPGRGAYIHCRSTCLDRATRRGRIVRALRIERGRFPGAPSSAEQVREAIASILEQAELSRVKPRTQCESAVADDNRDRHGLTWLDLRSVLGTSQPKDHR